MLNALIEQAREQEIIITAHYKALHQLRTGHVLPNAEKISNQVINLFVRPEVEPKHIEKTIEFINQFESK